jgi:hypothetical protein
MRKASSRLTRRFGRRGGQWLALRFSPCGGRRKGRTAGDRPGNGLHRRGRRQGPRATQEVVDVVIRREGGGTPISHGMPVELLVVTEAAIGVDTGVVSGDEAGKLLHGTSNGDTQGGVFALSFSVRPVPG